MAQRQGSACPWKLVGFPGPHHTEAGPSKVSRRSSGLDPRVLGRCRLSRATRHRWGSPRPQELAAPQDTRSTDGST